LLFLIESVLIAQRGNPAVTSPTSRNRRNLLPKSNAESVPRESSSLLQEKRDRLVDAFLQGRAPDFIGQHAQLLDDYFLESFELSMTGPRMDIIRNPYAMIALGGYGRQEQSLHSDIDLLFLFKKKVPPAAEALIREIVYPLWDLGFEVGYATRSLKECIHLAGSDHEVLTSLLDARFLCGVSLLYTELRELLHKKILFRQSGKIINWLVERNTARHLHFGDSSFLLEPNLKEGQGGLRDYHTMLWVGKIKFDFKQARDFEYHGQLSHDEYKGLKEALSFIWDVRSRLHHMTGRKCDHLHLEFQEALAGALKIRGKDGQKPVERFLGELHGSMEFVKQRYLFFLHELGYPRRTKGGRKAQKSTHVEGIVVSGDALNFSSPEKIVDAPELLIHVFEESARLKLPLGAEARRLVREFSHLVDDRFRRSPDVVKSFERILMAPAPVFNVLSNMLETGFLIRFIPAFENLVNRIQYNEYHIYPVDKHSLRTVQMLKSFGSPDDRSNEPLCARFFKEMKNRKRLVWAALLHDIGKGVSGKAHSEKGAKIAHSLLTRFGYSPREVETVVSLVRDHLLLVKVATRRDLNDEETAIALARRIGNVETLKMLYLLTIADSMATGPKAWNDWTSVLLRELFLKVLSTLERGELASQEAVELVEGKKAEIIGEIESTEEKTDIENIFREMSPRYLLYMPGVLIREHIDLYRQLGDRDFVWDIRRANGADTRTVIICAKDRPGLFSRIAGVFTLNGVDILDAQIFTWRNNVALDIFEVKPPPDQIFEDDRWRRAEENLRAALADKLDVFSLLKRRIKTYRPRKPPISLMPNRVVIDNDSSSFYSIIEVFTYDFPGLLFSITDALFRCDLDIWVAKIATKIDQVVDVFYVRDFNGEKVTEPDLVAAIEAAVLEALPGNRQ
jgi:[protein-PII] uridylyltransferase